jgi:hypothetical protein
LVADLMVEHVMFALNLYISVLTNSTPKPGCTFVWVSHLV